MLYYFSKNHPSYYVFLGTPSPHTHKGYVHTQEHTQTHKPRHHSVIQKLIFKSNFGNHINVEKNHCARSCVIIIVKPLFLQVCHWRRNLC